MVAIATIVIIGLGLIQMTVARIIDNHQIWPVDRLAGDYRAGRRSPDFGIANSIIQRKF